MGLQEEPADRALPDALTEVLAAKPPSGRKVKRTDAIAEELKDWIVLNSLKAGDRLPQERDLMIRFKASKGTIREALKALETQGLIRSRTGPGGGAFVAEPGVERAMELLGNYFFFRQPSIRDIYALRKRLEPDLAASLAGLLRDADLRRLEETMRLYDHPPETTGEEYQQRLAELEFHAILAELCPNPLLGFICGFLQSLLRNLTLCRRIYDTPNPELRDAGLHYQIRLLRALKAGQPEEASAVMYEHMCAAERYMEACEAEFKGAFLKL